MTDQPTPADWAIELALEPVNAVRRNVGYEPYTAHTVKQWPTTCLEYITTMSSAAMIEKYEPHRKPVDPLLVEARKIVAYYYREISGFFDLAAECERGDCDDNGHVSTVITALRRGMELAREADHG